MKVTMTGVYHPETKEPLAVEFVIGSFVWFYDFTDSFNSKLRLGRFPCRSCLDKPKWIRGHLVELNLDERPVAANAVNETLSGLPIYYDPVKGDGAAQSIAVSLFHCRAAMLGEG